jgi:hypothetical protein
MSDVDEEAVREIIAERLEKEAESLMMAEALAAAGRDGAGFRLAAQYAAKTAEQMAALLVEREALRADVETLQGINTEMLNEHEAAIATARAEGWQAGQEDMRERAAQVADGVPYKERYRMWPWWINRDGSEGNRSNDSDIVQHADKIAIHIRALPLTPAPQEPGHAE